MMLLGWVLAFVAALAAVRAASSLDRDFCQMPTAKVDFTEWPKPEAPPVARCVTTAQSALVGFSHAISLAQLSMSQKKRPARTETDGPGELADLTTYFGSDSITESEGVSTGLGFGFNLWRRVRAFLRAAGSPSALGVQVRIVAARIISQIQSRLDIEEQRHDLLSKRSAFVEGFAEKHFGSSVQHPANGAPEVAFNRALGAFVHYHSASFSTILAQLSMTQQTKEPVCL